MFNIEILHQQKINEKDRELLLIKGEILKMKEQTEEDENSSKKNAIKLERHILEQENQIKSLNIIIDDLKRDQREKISVEQRIEGKNREISLLLKEIDTLKEDIIVYKLNLGKKNDFKNEALEAELLKLCHQNKELKKEIADLKYRNEDLIFKQTSNIFVLTVFRDIPWII